MEKTTDRRITVEELAELLRGFRLTGLTRAQIDRLMELLTIDEEA